MKYKNPLTAIDRPLDSYGDPFVFRYQGQYYLFVSTPDGQTNIRVFTSFDLVSWKYMCDAVDEPLLEAAYAPEIIYCYNRFYLVTSPKGLGHYLYVSSQPQGPYTRVTHNVGSMIDGSFFVGPDAKLHLLRADHGGTVLLDVASNGVLSNRRNLGAYLNAWTEGPSLFYRDGYYYLTYCGNHLLSKGYRIAYATSTRFDQNFVEGMNNPLIINTHKGYTRLGHSSSVLGPDLDGYYIIYHTVIEKNHQYLPRQFMVDRLHFSGRLMYANSSDFNVQKPLRPVYETYSPQTEMINNDGFLLSNQATKKHYTIEASFKGLGVSLIVGYQSANHYTELRFDKNQITLVQYGQQENEMTWNCPFDFSYYHTVRIINGDKTELLIDNTPVAQLNLLPKGQIGYKGRGHFAYTAFSHHHNGTSDADYPSIIPGMIDINHRANATPSHDDPIDHIRYGELSEDSFLYQAKKKSTYALFIYAKLNNPVVLSVNGRQVVINPVESEYAYLSYYLGDFPLEKKGEIILKKISGTLLYKFLVIDELKQYRIKKKFITKKGMLLANRHLDSFYLAGQQDHDFDISVNFTLNKMRPFDVFGLLLQTRQYSNEYPQARLPLIGYLVGFEGGLLILDRLNYGRRRVYDRPTDIKEDINYELRVTFVNGLFKIYLNQQLLIVTTVSDPAYLGGHGLYASQGCSVVLDYPKNHNERRS